MNSFLTVNRITKRFPGADQAALAEVSFELQKQELLTLVGASGSGKTTLLRLLAGLENPDGGEIRLGDEMLSRGTQVLIPPEQRNFGFVFQNHALFPHLSVGANVAFGLAKSKERKKRIGDLLELVGLEALAGRFPHELSGGEQQRVALVRALASQPKLLLMDEPFSSLDTSLRRELREETRRLIRQQGATTILVTHDTDDALAVSDKIVVLRQGVAEQIGTPAEIYNQPANRYIASSFGPCNFLQRDLISNQSVLDTCRGIEPKAVTDKECWLRPERLSLSTGQDEQALVSGMVLHSHFHGESYLVELACESSQGHSFSVQVRQAGGHEVRTGDRLNIIPVA